MSSRSPAAVLSFAASDPTGGAGIQADLLTIAALGCHPLSVITAITVQDTHGVERMSPIDASLISAQAHRLLDDMPVAAFKAGVLGSSQNVRAVSEVIAQHSAVPFVVDPVLASGRGDPLAQDETIEALRELILPQTTMLTPNSIEARRLADGANDLAECARRLLDQGCEYVLITGTHEEGGDVVNTLYDASGVVREDRWPRLPASYHGSGCTLASAIAAELAKGLEPPEAAHAAQRFTWESRAAGFRPGGGQFLPNRFFRS